MCDKNLSLENIKGTENLTNNNKWFDLITNADKTHYTQREMLRNNNHLAPT